mmetsp:Transcript_34717/g.42820  ORF Transcript_34717/g.42820 Transcript_34717/m.42820 type:complete len:84 (-) Transcript_34717:24-275(-)
MQKHKLFVHLCTAVPYADLFPNLVSFTNKKLPIFLQKFSIRAIESTKTTEYCVYLERFSNQLFSFSDLSEPESKSKQHNQELR